MKKRHYFFYSLVKPVLFMFYRICFGFKFYGAGQVPDDADPRGVILAPNHASYLDPPILGISLKRHVTYLAKDYLFRPPVLGTLLRWLGIVPLKTQAHDFKSIRELIRILHEGRCITVFPEGTRSADGDFREAEGGVGFLAVKSQAYVVPTYIQGTFEAFPRGAKWFRCRPVRVYYGKPFVPALDKELMASPEPYLAVGRKIMDEIAELRKKAKIL
jgi:1-acyl-sn-glycerol-3-phosphate acyltransferase